MTCSLHTSCSHMLSLVNKVRVYANAPWICWSIRTAVSRMYVLYLYFHQVCCDNKVVALREDLLTHHMKGRQFSLDSRQSLKLPRHTHIRGLVQDRTLEQLLLKSKYSVLRRLRSPPDMLHASKAHTESNNPCALFTCQHNDTAVNLVYDEHIIPPSSQRSCHTQH